MSILSNFCPTNTTPRKEFASLSIRQTWPVKVWRLLTFLLLHAGPLQVVTLGTIQIACCVKAPEVGFRGALIWFLGDEISNIYY